MVKLGATDDAKKKIKELGGEIVFESEELINTLFVGSSEVVDIFLSALSKDEILEIARSGLSGVSSNEKLLTI